METKNTIDLTHTWAEQLKVALVVLTEGNADGRAIAREELEKMAKLADLYAEQQKKMPNGFASWHETHFHACEHIFMTVHQTGTAANVISQRHGSGGLWEMAEELTNSFENKYEGREWDGEYFDVLDEHFQEFEDSFDCYNDEPTENRAHKATDPVQRAKAVLDKAGYMVENLFQLQDIIEHIRGYTDGAVILTQEQAREIAQELADIDAASGINWDSIEAAYDSWKQDYD